MRPERLRKLYEYLRANSQVFFHFIAREDCPPDAYYNFCHNFDELLKENEKHPYIRIGQNLIIKGIAEERDNLWQRDVSWFIQNNYFKFEELLLWGTYGKNQERSIPEYKFFCDLETDHIRNILKDGNISIHHAQLFTKILIERENE